MTEKELELTAYRLIRIKSRHYENLNDEQLANYVRGVVDLQTEIYSDKVCIIAESEDKNARSD